MSSAVCCVSKNRVTFFQLRGNPQIDSAPNISLLSALSSYEPPDLARKMSFRALLMVPPGMMTILMFPPLSNPSSSIAHEDRGYRVNQCIFHQHHNL